jgi:hypothetical protein
VPDQGNVSVLIALDQGMTINGGMVLRRPDKKWRVFPAWGKISLSASR